MPIEMNRETKNLLDKVQGTLYSGAYGCTFSLQPVSCLESPVIIGAFLVCLVFAAEAGEVQAVFFSATRQACPGRAVWLRMHPT